MLALRVQDRSERLEAATNATFRGDDMDELALEIQMGILEAETIDLLLLMRLEGDGDEVKV